MQCETALLDQLAQIAVGVFASMLQLEVNPVESAPLATSEMAALVRIQGAWNGAVLLQCTRTQAFDWACRLLGIDRQEIDQESIEDALGEIVNMIGGNWKAMLPPRNVLSVPTIFSRISVSDFTLWSGSQTCLTFSSEQGAFSLCLLGQVTPFQSEQESEVREQIYA